MPLHILILAGAAHGLLLALALALLPRLRPRAQALRLAGLLAAASVVCVLIVLEHAGLTWPRSPFDALEQSLTLLSGPLLLSYVRSTVHLRGVGAVAFLPWALHGIALLVAPRWTLRHIDMVPLVFCQMAYTAAAGAAVVRQHRAVATGPRPTSIALVLGAMAAVHVAQLIRIAWSDVAALENIVPATLALAFVTLQAHALVQSRALAGLVAPADDPRRVAAARDDGQALLQWLQASARWRDPQLDAATLAIEMSWTSARLGAAIAALGEPVLHGVLNRFRIAEARRLLEDPAERRYTVEGLGRQAGFGSRSAFYKVFQAETGCSPAAYRRRHAPA